jgi:hypothetical protein
MIDDAEDGTALYKTPTGAMWHGKWEIKGNTACADWKEKPNKSVRPLRQDRLAQPRY